MATTVPFLLPTAELDWGADGVPRSGVFGDVYFSVADGLAETHAVFHAGCNLPAAWENTQHFTIAELGFGTGLNFLATWQLFNATQREGQHLHYISTEGFPLTLADATRALSHWPELQPLATQLLAQWPLALRGVQRLCFPNVTLTLWLGDVAETLPQMEFTADAWFLDGFAPSKNPAMWEGIYQHLARLSRSGTRAATYSVAVAVQRGLAAAGFIIEKVPGFGRKRERLQAVKS